MIRISRCSRSRCVRLPFRGREYDGTFRTTASLERFERFEQHGRLELTTHRLKPRLAKLRLARVASDKPITGLTKEHGNRMT